MNHFVSAKNYRSQGYRSNSLLTRLLAGPLQLGVWSGEDILWIYPRSRELIEPLKLELAVTSMNSTREYEMIKFGVTNNTDDDRAVKVIVQYQNIFNQHSTTFYSPNENSIVSFSGDYVTVLGGLLNNKGMVQYSIQEHLAYGTEELVSDLKKGSLPMNWLGQGNILSIFTLETVLKPNESSEGTIWTFHSESEEAVQALKREKVDNHLL